MTSSQQSDGIVISDIVSGFGGYLERTLNCVSEFHAKHGAWPSKLQLSHEADEALRDHLTPRGYSLLLEKLQLSISPNEDMALVALGEEGRSLDYGKEGWSGADLPRADVWIWGINIHGTDE